MELFSLAGVAILLALGVTFLNGFTDAPNSIATTVATGALSMNRACALSPKQTPSTRNKFSFVQACCQITGAG